MISPYDKNDRSDLIDLCEEFWSASYGKDFPFDEAHTEKMLDKMLNQGACIVLDEDGVSGFIFMVFNPMLCNPATMGAEVAWYVKPSVRGGSGIKLLNAMEDYCRKTEVSIISMMYMECSMPEKVKTLYNKKGYSLAETTYCKRLK